MNHHDTVAEIEKSVEVVLFNPNQTVAVGELISKIQQKEFGIPITLEQQPDLANIPEVYQKDNGNFWVACFENKVIGTISLLDIGNGQVALRKMFVHLNFRGSKYQTSHKLLLASFEWCQKKNVETIFLGTTDKFLAAHRFYEKNGFKEISKDDLPKAFPVMAVDTKFYSMNFK